MIIGMIGDTFTAAQTRITRASGVVITADNLVDGFRLVDAPQDETGEPEEVARVWAPGLWVDPGNLLTRESVTYRVRQRHCTQADWLPSVVLALYEVVPMGSEWQAGVTYATNDVVSYGGTDYRCVQGHTSQVGWEPPAVPALWELVT